MKASKATAHYRDRPNDAQHCSRCTMFEPPNACSSVTGFIKPYGWCFYYKAKPTKWRPSATHTTEQKRT